MRCPRWTPTAWFAFIFAVGTAAHVCLPRSITPWIAWMPLQILGTLLLMAALGLNLAASRAFKTHATSPVPYTRPDALITTGVFRFSRHPVYLALVLSALGLGCLLDAVTFLPGSLVLGVVLDRCVVPDEERQLQATFGETYRRYRERTRRWL